MTDNTTNSPTSIEQVIERALEICRTGAGWALLSEGDLNAILETLSPTTIEQPCQTPLVELLRAVPEDARMTYEHSPTHHQMIPVGRLCHEAAEALCPTTPPKEQSNAT